MLLSAAMYSYGVSEGALLRRNADESLIPDVYWPSKQEWHVLPDIASWVESRPVTGQQAAAEFPGVDLEAEVVFDPDDEPESEAEPEAA